jgi:hypothetical protein
MFMISIHHYLEQSMNVWKHSDVVVLALNLDEALCISWMPLDASM